MGVNPIVRDRDPAVTLRRVLSVVNAIGDSAPRKVTEWVALVVQGDDGDVAKVVAFARAATDGRMLHTEAVAVIRDVCARRLGDQAQTWRGRA